MCSRWGEALATGLAQIPNQGNEKKDEELRISSVKPKFLLKSVTYTVQFGVENISTSTESVLTGMISL